MFLYNNRKTKKRIMKQPAHQCRMNLQARYIKTYLLTLYHKRRAHAKPNLHSQCIQTNIKTTIKVDDLALNQNHRSLRANCQIILHLVLIYFLPRIHRYIPFQMIAYLLSSSSVVISKTIVHY